MHSLKGPTLDPQPQAKDSSSVLSDFISTKLAVAVNSINKADRDLCNSVAHRLGQHHQLHLEDVAFALYLRYDSLQHVLLV